MSTLTDQRDSKNLFIAQIVFARNNPCSRAVAATHNRKNTAVQDAGTLDVRTYRLFSVSQTTLEGDTLKTVQQGVHSPKAEEFTALATVFDIEQTVICTEEALQQALKVVRTKHLVLLEGRVGQCSDEQQNMCRQVHSAEAARLVAGRKRGEKQRGLKPTGRKGPRRLPKLLQNLLQRLSAGSVRNVARRLLYLKDMDRVVCSFRLLLYFFVRYVVEIPY